MAGENEKAWPRCCVVSDCRNTLGGDRFIDAVRSSLRQF